MRTPFARRTRLGASLLVSLALCGGAHGREPADGRVLAADSRETTSAGASFTAPRDWRIARRGNVVELIPPEPDSRMFLVDVDADSADRAVEKAWAAAGIVPSRPLKLALDRPGRDGWSSSRSYEYSVPANEQRVVAAQAWGNGGTWTVMLLDATAPALDKRRSQVQLVVDRLLPEGKTRESFAGRKAHVLDPARLEALRAFVRETQAALGIPGVSLGIVQDGKVLMSEGFGVRELGKPAPVDGDTLYMVASNTKAMTTLMLGRMVDAGLIRWDTPVVDMLPGFRLGDADTTGRVQVQHLVCACTGLPRQDLEWLMEFEDATPESTLATLSTMQPTTGFGALYQYSNPLASAGGYAGARVLHPELPLGEAYDRAMREQVFEPLGMARTTFDMDRALSDNHARPHALDLTGTPRNVGMEINHAVVPLRPAGGAWSSVNDMLRYVLMELGNGATPEGRRIASEAVIAERRKARAVTGNDSHYGMGLQVDTTWGVPVVHHGGSMIGYKSDMMWLPEHGVGAVILANGEDARPMLAGLRRRLLEVLFDGSAQAAEDMAAAAAATRTGLEKRRSSLSVPADAGAAQALAPLYRNAALGSLAVVRDGAGHLRFDLGEYALDVGTVGNEDGSRSYVTTSPGLIGLEFVANADGNLVLRSPQKEYVFNPVDPD